jgi:hypothetical protein
MLLWVWKKPDDNNVDTNRARESVRLLVHEASRANSSPLKCKELRCSTGRHLASLDTNHNFDRDAQELHLKQVSQMLLKSKRLDDH